MLINCLFVGFGGFIGSVCRYLMGFVPQMIARNSVYGTVATTFAINVIGAFAIGFIVSAFSKSSTFSPELLLLLKVGVCGGFTTFSTFSLESLQLIQSGAWPAAAVYMVASVIACLVAVFAGDAAGSAFASK